MTTPLISQTRSTQTLPVPRGTRSQVTSALPSRALFYPIHFRKTFKKSEEVRNHRVFVLEEKTKSSHVIKYTASEHRLSPEPSAPTPSSHSEACTRQPAGGPTPAPCRPGSCRLWRPAEGTCAHIQSGSLTGAQRPQPRSRASGPDPLGERRFQTWGCRGCFRPRAPPSSPKRPPTRFLLLLSNGARDLTASNSQ